MKKLISTILTFIIIIITQSCRQQEDLIISNDDNNQENLIFKRDSDSVKADSASIPEKPVIGDPPPKNGHQW